MKSLSRTAKFWTYSNSTPIWPPAIDEAIAGDADRAGNGVSAHGGVLQVLSARSTRPVTVPMPPRKVMSVITVCRS